MCDLFVLICIFSEIPTLGKIETEVAERNSHHSETRTLGFEYLKIASPVERMANKNHQRVQSTRMTTLIEPANKSQSQIR